MMSSPWGEAAEIMIWPFARREPIPHHTDAFIEHLKGEVTFWRLQFMKERQRAEQSIDHRLHERGLGPVSGPLRFDVPPDQTTERMVQELLTNPEFAQAGQVDG